MYNFLAIRDLLLLLLLLHVHRPHRTSDRCVCDLFFLKIFKGLFNYCSIFLFINTATRRPFRCNPRRFLRIVVGIIPPSFFVVVFVPIGWQFGGVPCVVVWWTARPAARTCRCGCNWRRGRRCWFVPLYRIGNRVLVIRLAISRFVFDPTVGEHWIGSGGSRSGHFNA